MNRMVPLDALVNWNYRPRWGREHVENKENLVVKEGCSCGQSLLISGGVVIVILMILLVVQSKKSKKG